MTFKYYKLQLRLATPMLGTSTEGSIYHEHIQEKTRKEVEKANRLGKKIEKSLDKYKGTLVDEDKMLQELQGVVRTLCQLVGRPLDVPNTTAELLALSTELEDTFKQQIKDGENVKATIFMRDNEGKPIVPTHMILGNIKENLKIMVNNGDKTIMKSKVSVGETLALDVKFVENFMNPSKDILRAETQAEVDRMENPGKGKLTLDTKKRVLLERPIRFSDPMGRQVTAISLSEMLPVGTEMQTTMRVRRESPLDLDSLKKLFSLGMNNGLGAWRGSGNMGAYNFKLEEIDYKEQAPEGWS